MRSPDLPTDDDREIVLQNPNRYPEARARRLRPWLERLLDELSPGSRSLGVRFSGDREMRRVNRQYRDKDKATDVLSFPGDGGHLGDILISVPVARQQAGEAGHDVERELKILLLHGILHCMGYDHETDQGEMERLERRLRRTWIPSPPDPKAPFSPLEILPTVETPRGASPAATPSISRNPRDAAGTSGEGDAPRGVSTVGDAVPETENGHA